MGIVWLARDEKLERPVALKFLPDTLFLDAASRDELKRETRRSLDLTHANVVRIHDFVEDDHSAAISMEYIDGPSLSQLRVEKATRCFEAHELSGWVADLCRALDYAHHSAGFVHRDLKPANLMVTSRGALKVTDFGIACGLQNTAARISAWTSTGGTLGYMSPQQLEGELAAVTDDIYSLGATLYELLTSKPPFHSGDISLQIRATVAERMKERRGKLGINGAPIPEEWEATIAACLAKNPRERPASAGEVARRLGVETLALSATEGESPEQMTFVERKPRLSAPPGRQIALAGVNWRLITGAVALVIVTAFTLEFSRSVALPKTGLARPPATIVASKTMSDRTPGNDVTAGPAKVVPAEPPPAPPEHSAAGAMPDEIQPQPSSVPTEILGILPLDPPRLALQTTPSGLPFALFSEASDAVPIRQGQTPVNLEGLAAGKYRLVMGASPWPTHSAVIEVAEHGATEFAHDFPRGFVHVESTPPGAEIFVGEDAVGKAPLDLPLPPGSHVVTAEFQDRTSRPRKVEVVAGEEDKLSFDFRPSASTTSRTARRPKKIEESALTKISRSIQNLFNGDKTKKR